MGGGRPTLTGIQLLQALASDPHALRLRRIPEADFFSPSGLRPQASSIMVSIVGHVLPFLLLRLLCQIAQQL